MEWKIRLGQYINGLMDYILGHIFINRIRVKPNLLLSHGIGLQSISRRYRHQACRASRLSCITHVAHHACRTLTVSLLLVTHRLCHVHFMSRITYNCITYEKFTSVQSVAQSASDRRTEQFELVSHWFDASHVM